MRNQQQPGNARGSLSRCHHARTGSQRRQQHVSSRWPGRAARGVVSKIHTGWRQEVAGQRAWAGARVGNWCGGERQNNASGPARRPARRPAARVVVMGTKLIGGFEEAVSHPVGSQTSCAFLTSKKMWRRWRPPLCVRTRRQHSSLDFGRRESGDAIQLPGSILDGGSRVTMTTS